LTQAIRLGNWKAVKSNPEAPWELYDLAKDIGETKNVAAQNRKIVSRIAQYAQAAREKPRPQVEPVKVKGRRYR
jgi:arylsulfatase A-like enzyme